jgi:uncharacterized protein (DUF2235 family)
MARNLVVCCDGTNNQFGPENISVVRVVQVADRDSERQLVYYDPGVGTLPEPGMWAAIGKRLSEWIDLAFGTWLIRVEQAYCYLTDFWEPGGTAFSSSALAAVRIRREFWLGCSIPSGSCRAAIQSDVPDALQFE